MVSYLPGVSRKRKKLAADAADNGTGMLCQSDFKMEFIYPVFCCGNDLRLHTRFGYTHKKEDNPLVPVSKVYLSGMVSIILFVAVFALLGVYI